MFSEIYALLKDVNEKFSRNLYIYCSIGLYSVQEMSTKNLKKSFDFHGNRRSKSLL